MLKKKQLIGKTINGATIDEIIICPTEPRYFQIFEQTYFQTQSAEYAISPFESENVEIAVIIGKNSLKENLFIKWKTLEWAENHLDKKTPNR